MNQLTIRKTLITLLAVLLVSSFALGNQKNAPAKEKKTEQQKTPAAKPADLPEKLPASNPPISISNWDKEFLEWLGEHYVGYYNTMLSLEKKPEEYKKNFKILKRRYSEIKNAHQRNPELGLAKMDELRNRRTINGKVNALKEANDQKERDNLIKVLRIYVAKQFETNVKISRLTHAELKARIQKLSKELVDREKKLQTMIKDKDKEIEKQVQSLLKKAEPAPKKGPDKNTKK